MKVMYRIPSCLLGPGDNSVFYTLPSLMDGLSVNASYKPQGSGTESGTGYGLSYTGIEGLTASYATSDVVKATAALSGDHLIKLQLL